MGLARPSSALNAPARHVSRHACVVAAGGVGILIEGESGAGKTSLAFGLIDAARRRGLTAAFVADDRAMIDNVDGQLIASAPASIAGLAELRGFGIVQVDTVRQAPVGLVARLVDDRGVERMPEAESVLIEGVSVPLLLLPRRHEAQAVRILLAWLSQRLGFSL